jgi:hypothetical protein
MCRSCSYEDSKSVGVGCRSRHLSHLSFTNSSGFFQFAVHVGPEPALLKVRPGLLYVLIHAPACARRWGRSGMPGRRCRPRWKVPFAGTFRACTCA